ncbi:sortase, partial [Candidatus Saccharibacteria bacterium]|nr:sortase [Candidatus Saccharibacteria bacterium]
EFEEAEETPKSKRSKHQEFIYNLTNSGRPLHEINAAWHEYYAGLADTEKHEVWQDFYNSHTKAAHHPAVSHEEPKPEPIKSIIRHRVAHAVKPKAKQPPRAKKAREAQPIHSFEQRTRAASPFHSLLFGLGIGSIVLIIFLFGFFNERIIAPFIQPSRNTVNIPLIIPGSGSHIASAAPEIIIPKINVEVPVVYGVTSTDESVVQKALEVGVLHYADTAAPGQDGNLVIVGHSAGNIFSPGQYKYVFSLLHRLDNGDVFYLQKDSTRYTYQVYKKAIVKPTDVGVLAPQPDSAAVATLITCDPPGVSSNRLIIVGKQIDPDPTANVQTVATGNVATTKTAILPSDSRTLWSRLVHWFER